ncbi:MAG: hypothetical protein R3330_04350 [Saprospiraceae bacterium]|nr:hypothetical protein [Saprospiraceae bacterium]
MKLFLPTVADSRAMRSILLLTGMLCTCLAWAQLPNLTLKSNGKVGVNTSDPTGYFHIEVPAITTSSGLISNINYTGLTDIRAVQGLSTAVNGYGLGGYFEGGYMGVRVLGDGGDYASASFPVYGVYSEAVGTAGTRIGLFSQAFGGDLNLAAKFGAGDVQVDNMLRINAVQNDGRLHVRNTDNIGSNATAVRIDASNDGSETVYGTLVTAGNSGTGTAIGHYAAVYDVNDLAFYGFGNSYFTGDVRIGQNVDPYSGAYKLVVDGKILAEELRVQNSLDWPDYVFSEEYELTTLGDVEVFIRKHGHLPHLPSAAQVEKDGIVLGEMQALLLRQIEELTLHVIRQQKEIDLLKQQITAGDER